MAKGIADRILRVNLSSRTVTTDSPGEAFYRHYLGGAGIVSYYLLKEVPKGADPFSPENKLVFAAGPMTGVPLPGGARNCVGAKSPLTFGYSKSEVGGHWGYELRRAGYDAIIVEGKADSPVYLWVTNDKVEIRDARHLWGKPVIESQDAIAQELGDRLVKSMIIGPAGENLVRIACITGDLRNAAGRGGLGAVMGSKNLKAIMVRGHKAPDVTDPDKVREMARWMNTNWGDVKWGFGWAFHDFGTGRDALMVGGNKIGNLPVRNWGDGDFPEVVKITANAVRATYSVGMEACAGCQVRCKKVVELEQPYKVNRRAGGPEYETLAAIGSFCGIDDLAAICKGNELASDYSLDTISLGGVIAFAMECFEKEVLSPRDTDGLDLRFGNAEAMLKAIELITYRKGIGDVLAEGVRLAARKIGRGSEEYAMHVKGLEIGMHEPRVKRGLGVTYAVNPHGGDHMMTVHDTLFSQEGAMVENLRSIGVTRPFRADDLSPAKVAAIKAAHLWRIFGDSLVCCQFLPYSPNQQVEVIRAITGWDYSTWEAMRLGERVATMGRAFNLREGLTADDDWLPKRFFGPTPRGALKDDGLDPAAMREAIRTFYTLMGWTPDGGIPTRQKLADLDIEWVAEALPAAA